MLYLGAQQKLCLYTLQFSFRFGWNLIQEWLQNLLTDCSFREGRLKTAVISAIVGFDPTDSQEILPETSIAIVQFILRQRVSFSDSLDTAAIMA